MSENIKLSFFGAAGTVTGSCHLVNTGVGKVMIDCGMFQGTRENERRNYLGFGFDPSDVDFLLLTHAHIDHIGLVPRLVKFGFNGRIISTRATRDLARILLLDSAHIQQRDAEYARKKKVEQDSVRSHPLYTKDDVEAAMRLFHAVDYEEEIELSRGISARYRDAGHIIGSASIELSVKTAEGAATLVASGDIGIPGSAILKDPRAFESADYLLLESTYGDRTHDDRGDRKSRLKAEIERMLEAGGPLLIPSFAVGRTQRMLYLLSILRRENPGWPKFPVYVDSPLASKATAILNRHPECFDDELSAMLAGGENPFDAESVRFTESVDESKALNGLKGPRVIVAASGMCTAGRIRHHIKNHIADERAALLFVGYQAYGTLGRHLIEGAESVKLFGREHPVRARVSSIGGFSAHADRNGLIEWLKSMTKPPKRVFLVHGEPEAAAALSEDIRALGIDCHVAQTDETVVLPLVHPVEVPSPVHPGDSAKNRISRYLGWLSKEIGDADFVLDEIASELPGWLDGMELPLTPVQSAGVVYDDMVAATLPLLLKVLSAYEEHLASSAGNGELGSAVKVLSKLRNEIETAVTASRRRVLECIDEG